MYKRPFPGPHKWTDTLGNTYIDGYLYMGPVAIPPLPPRVAMQDRTTGDYKVLSYTGSAGSLALELVDLNSKWTDVQKYGPQAGPYLNGYRLYLDSGSLATEVAEQEISQGKIYARKGNSPLLLQLTVDASGTIVYTEISV